MAQQGILLARGQSYASGQAHPSTTALNYGILTKKAVVKKLLLRAA